MSTEIDCPIWGENYKAILHSQWVRSVPEVMEEDLVHSPRTGGPYRLTPEVFARIHNGRLEDKQKAKLTTWLIDQRQQGIESPVVTTGVLDAIIVSNSLSRYERDHRLLQFLVNKSENLGDQINVGKYGEMALVVSESLGWMEVFFLLKHLSDQGFIEYKDTRNPSECRAVVTVKGYERIEMAESTVPTRPQNFKMKVFMSHSGRDAELARLLVNLIQKAMRLSSNDIRCSSVDGYRLPGGVSTDERLRMEVYDAELVVGLITPNSLKSLYVAFELGARWGVDKPMIPLLASGALPEHLGGPLAKINALRCDNESHVNQLIEETELHLSIEPERPSSLVGEIEKLVQKASSEVTAIESPSSTASNPQLSPKARELILAATEKDAGYIHHVRAMSGQMISAGGTTMNEFGDHRSEAEWISAIQQLESGGFVIDHNGERKYFEVTGVGYSLADELREKQS